MEEASRALSVRHTGEEHKLGMGPKRVTPSANLDVDGSADPDDDEDMPRPSGIRHRQCLPRWHVVYLAPNVGVLVLRERMKRRLITLDGDFVELCEPGFLADLFHEMSPPIRRTWLRVCRLTAAPECWAYHTNAKSAFISYSIFT
jgi:hypothetical protein